MKPGDKVELAIWMTGEEKPEHIEHWKNVQIPALMQVTEQQHGVEIKNIEFFEKLPGQERVPPVPDHIKGIDVRLLVCEADVFHKPKYTAINKSTGFVHDLQKQDLNRLRKITRSQHMKATGRRLTDFECDQMIEALGPQIVERMILSGKTDA